MHLTLHLTILAYQQGSIITHTCQHTTALMRTCVCVCMITFMCPLNEQQAYYKVSTGVHMFVMGLTL